MAGPGAGRLRPAPRWALEHADPREGGQGRREARTTAAGAYAVRPGASEGAADHVGCMARGSRAGRAEATAEPHLQGEEVAGGAGVALAPRAATQLVVDAARLVPLGAHNVQPAQLLHLALLNVCEEADRRGSRASEQQWATGRQKQKPARGVRCRVLAGSSAAQAPRARMLTGHGLVLRLNPEEGGADLRGARGQPRPLCLPVVVVAHRLQ